MTIHLNKNRVIVQSQGGLALQNRRGSNDFKRKLLITDKPYEKHKLWNLAAGRGQKNVARILFQLFF